MRCIVKCIINSALSKILNEKIMTLQFNPQDYFFNTKQLAQYLGVSPQRIRYMIAKKYPDLKKDGRDWLLNKLQAEDLKQRRPWKSKKSDK